MTPSVLKSVALMGWTLLPSSAVASGCSTERPWHSHFKCHLKGTFADLGHPNTTQSSEPLPKCMSLTLSTSFWDVFMSFHFQCLKICHQSIHLKFYQQHASYICVGWVYVGCFGHSLFCTSVYVGVREPVLSVNCLPPVVHTAATASRHWLFVLAVCPGGLYSHGLVFVHDLLFAQQCQCQLRP